MSSRKILLAGASVFALGLALEIPEQAFAQVCGSSPIASNCSQYDWTGGDVSINGGVIVSGTPAVHNSANAGTLTNSGTISSSAVGGFGLLVTVGTVAAVKNSGAISGANTISSSAGINNLSTIGTVTNQSGATISGGYAGISNNGYTNSTFTNVVLGTIINSGLIVGTSTVTAKNGIVNSNSSRIDVLQNNSTGTITSLSSGIYNFTNATIGTITNSGLIQGGIYAIGNDTGGSIGTIENSGTIVGTTRGVTNSSTIGTIINDNGGTITANYGVYNIGTIGGIDNGSGGTITGSQYAIYNNSGTMGTITNSGIIAGSIYSTGNLTFAGGSSGTVGTLTGLAGSIGTLTASRVVFASGDLLLNDRIAVGGGTVSNSGADVTIGTIISITGNFSQSSGTLSLGGTGELVVSGNATLTGGTIVDSLAGTGNYLAGNTATLISANAANYSGATVSYDTPTGLATTIDTGGSTNLVAQYLNDYVGGSLPNLANTGTINSAYGLYVAASGSLGNFDNSGSLSGSSYAIYSAGTLGTLTNSGLIAGNIYSAGNLSVAGGAAGTVGTLTGLAGSLGTLTAAGVVFASGGLLLNDNIAVGGGTVSNSGASVTIATIVNITGNYSQSSGTLSLGGTGELVVSGNAALTGGTIVGSLSGAGNYLAGSGSTLIGASSGSYGGATVLYSTPTGLATTIDTGGGTSLVARYLNDYVGGSLASLANTGTINSTYGLYVAAGGSLGNFDNSGSLSGSSYAIYSAGTLGTLTNSGLIAGNIYSAGTLAVAGGSSGAVGTLTGSGGSLGTLTAANVTFGSGVLLLDDNIVVGGGSGSAINSARLQVNRPVSINGNYVQTAGGSALMIGVTSPTSYGQLVVSGNATLGNSAITLTALGGANSLAGHDYTIVSAGSLSADAASLTVTAPSGLSDTVAITGSTLIVTLNAGGATTAPSGSWTAKGLQAGGGAVPIGAVLDALAGNPDYSTLLSELQALPAAAQNKALKQLGASRLVPQVNVAAVVVQPVANAVGSRQVALLDGAGKAAGSETARTGVWGQVLGGQAIRDTRTSADGYSATSFGLMVGADTHVTDDVVAGLGFSWLRADANGKGDAANQSTTLDSYQLTAYGAWRPGQGPLHFQAQVGAGFNQYDQKRTVDFQGATAGAQYDGRQYQAKVGAGYDLPAGFGMTATPQASLQAVRVENDAYHETGAGSRLDQTVGRLGFNALESEMGARLSSPEVRTGWGWLNGDLQAGWVHEFTQTAIATSATMGGQGYLSTTGRTAADGARIGVGLDLHASDALAVRVEYQADLRPDYRGQTGLLKVRYDF